MMIKREFPYAVKVIENEWIPMSDGVQLAARIWLPQTDDPVPTILEYIPYRKRDHTRLRDDANHGYFAGHGYACIRVDIRGSGDSEGVLTDEYLEQEQKDGLEILKWIESRPWSDGKVGMIGISWGGFNGLQFAALAPPQLQAVITVCSTDDRYTDDVHYMGGCLLGDNLSWASIMFARNALPPDPGIVGSRWRRMWLERMKESGVWAAKWMEHQRRDSYWKHGSVCEDFDAIRCPVMAVSGWADGYSNAVFRLLSKLSVPRKGLIGPWSHKYPHVGEPGPAIGFLQESLRWWDQWLKGIDTGVKEEPMLRVWMLDSVPPVTSYKERPGRWVAEPEWPSETIQETRYGLAPGKLLTDMGERVLHAPLTIRSPLRVGLFAGKWCSYSAPPDLPGDQREEDGGALVFESEPLETPIEILGPVAAELEIASDKPVAQVAVRLSDVAHDGKATRVTYGLLNLTHRNSHEHPSPLEPGKRYSVRVQMNDIAQTFPAGHRLRLSVSSSYWPLAWPPPELTTLTLYPKNCFMLLSTRPRRKIDRELRPFDRPEAAPVETQKTLFPGDHQWRVIRDLARDVSTLEVIKDDGIIRIDAVDLDIESRMKEIYSVFDDDVDSVQGETHWVRGYRRKDWNVRIITRTVLTSNRESFEIKADIDAYEGDARIFTRTWNFRIPRDFL